MSEVAEKLRAQLIRDEGYVAHAYQDSLGYWTIGVGHLIDQRRGGMLPRSIIEALLDYDIDEHGKALISAFPWVADLDPVRQAVLINMAFNLGLDGLSKFGRTLALIHDGSYSQAAAEMLSSAWATQVGARAHRLAAQMESGAWQ